MHYNQGIVIDEDYHQDMQLPFKSVPSNVCFILGDIHGLPLMEMTPMPGKIGKEKSGLLPRFTILLLIPHLAAAKIVIILF